MVIKEKNNDPSKVVLIRCQIGKMVTTREPSKGPTLVIFIFTNARTGKFLSNRVRERQRTCVCPGACPRSRPVGGDPPEGNGELRLKEYRPPTPEARPSVPPSSLWEKDSE